MHSVGVQRQYSGTLGKTGNGQLAVTCHYAERTLAWSIAAPQYLPKRWAEDRDRRRFAHVPDDVVFRTKPQLALALLDEARALGVRHACVTVDADYGDRPSFLNALADDQSDEHPHVLRVSHSGRQARQHRAFIPRRGPGHGGPRTAKPRCTTRHDADASSEPGC